MEQVAVAAWAAFLVFVVAEAAIAPESHSVYPTYMRAAANWMQGRELYGGGIDFRYGPPVAAWFVPLRLLPERLGAALWRVISAGALLAALGWWVGTILPAEMGRNRRALVYLLVFPLAVSSLNNGQVNPLLIALILGALCAANRGWWMLACGLVMVAGIFKVYPLAILGLLLAAYPRQVWWRMILVAAGFLLATLLLQHPGYVVGRYEEWIHALRTDNRDAWGIIEGPRDFRLLLRLLVGDPPPMVYRGIQAGSAIFVGWLCYYARCLGRPRREVLLLILGLGSYWMMLWGPATESNTFVILAPAAAWAVIWAPPRRMRLARFCWLLAVAGFVVLLGSKTFAWFPEVHLLGSLGFAPAGVLLMFVALVIGTLAGFRAKAGAEVGVDSAVTAH